MASAPNAELPLFYKRLEPLSSTVHGNMKARMIEGASFLEGTHAVPVTAEEFGLVQRTFPIVFSSGPDPVPLALMGLNEGVNTYFNADGRIGDDFYVPAYIRRYPFMLARLFQDRDELTLCFDPTSGAIGDHDGEVLFENGEPSAATKATLGFCEQFETAGQRTAAFVKELQDLKLLIDGEVTIQPEGAPQPFIYRGFQMVNEEAVRELRGDVARRLIQSGAMPLIYAHLFSLLRVQDIFARQQAQGKGPMPALGVPEAATA